MNAIRKLLWLGTAVLAVAFAAPSVAAPQKLYSLLVCVGTFANIANPPTSADPTACNVAQSQLLGQPTVPTPIQARIFNQSPPTSNSTINAVDLFVNVNWKAVASTATVLDNPGKWSIDVSTASHVKISNLSPVKPQRYVTVQFNVDGFSCGQGTWDATPYTGSTPGSGATFAPATGYVRPTTLVACAQLSCNQVISNVQPQGSVLNTDASFIATLQRGIDEDGTASTCSKLYAYVTPTITTDNALIQTIWDKTQFDSNIAVFSYVINLRPTTATTVPDKLAEIRVAWLTKTDSTPDFQRALLCDSSAPGLPMQYTTLVEDDGNKIQVASAVAQAPPFPIIIEQERLLVTKINANTPTTWFVTRAIGGTTQVTHTTPDVPVVSTPFPIVQATDGYVETYHPYVNLPAKVCINGLSQSPTDPTQFTATVIDGGDTWVLAR